MLTNYYWSMYANTSSRNANPATLSTMEGSHYYHFKVWYDLAGNKTHDLPHPMQMLYHYTINVVLILQAKAIVIHIMLV